MRILVTTPTGRIGSRIVETLIPSGHALTLLARDPNKLPAEVRAAARVLQGSLDEPDRLAAALDEADVAFFLIPPPSPETPHWRHWQEDTGRAFAEAAVRRGVARVVFLSSTGAQHDDMGAISGLGAVERILTAALPNVLCIRAGYFMENFIGSLPTVASPGAVFGVFDGDARLPIVATRDIGDLAASWLTDGSWFGHYVIGSHGPSPLTQHEVATILGEVLGRQVAYVRIPPSALREALLQAGLPPLIAHGYEEMMGGVSRHLDAGDYQSEPHTPQSTGVVDFRTFAEQVLRPAFEAQFAGA